MDEMRLWLKRLRIETGDIAEEIDHEVWWLCNFTAANVFAHITWITRDEHVKIWEPI